MESSGSSFGDVSRLYSERATNAIKNPLVGTYRDPSTIKHRLGTGLPDSALFPIEDLKEYAVRALDEYGTQCLSYGAGGTGGFAGPLILREQIAARTKAVGGRDVGPDGIVLCSGASHGLALAANAYLSPGDAIFVEALSWPWALRYMSEAGATAISVPMDRDGMRVDLLPEKIAQARAQGLRPKMVYTIPTFHIPTATCMPEGRRRDLLALAAEHDLVVLEDNLYYDLRYVGDPVPSLLALDDRGAVVQQNGFSKTLATGLRLGWVTGDPATVLPLEYVRQDLGVNQFTAHLLALWMADGKWDGHIAQIVESAGRKHALVTRLLAEHCQPHVSYDVPDGGIYFWLELRPSIDGELFRRIVFDEGLDLAPGERFSGDDSGRQFFRLAYLDLPDDQLVASIELLGRCLTAAER